MARGVKKTQGRKGKSMKGRGNNNNCVHMWLREDGVGHLYMEWKRVSNK